MSTRINLTYNDKEYTLEYNKNAARNIEAQGFSLEELGSKPTIMIPLLVQGAFYKNHKMLSKNTIAEIYDHVAGKTGSEGEQGFISVLTEMYAEVINSLMEDPDEGDTEGNVATWKVLK